MAPRGGPSPAAHPRPRSRRLGPVRPVSRRLTAREIRLTPRDIAIAKARNTTAVETDNTTFWSAFRPAHETSRDSAVDLAPRSRWRCGHLRPVEKGLFVVVIVGAVVMLFGDSPLAPMPYTAAMAATAAPVHNMIASLPLLFVII